jgi:uncharacterized protein YgiM (DUF1202 family)
MKQLLFYALIALLLSTGTIFAKTINLYSEPKTNSKVIGSVNLEKGVTLVYTPKNSDWVKVANPANGDVGWIKSAELSNNSYTMHIINSDNNSHGYKFYQFAAGSNVDDLKLDEEFKQLEKHKRIMENNIAHILNDMFYIPQPLFIPIVMMAKVPNQNDASSNQSFKSSHTTKK